MGKHRRFSPRCSSIGFISFILIFITSLIVLSHFKIKRDVQQQVVTLNKLSVSRHTQRIRRELNENKHNIVKRGAGNSFVEAEPSSSQGTAYVRWGRHDCNGDAKLIHSGYAAGSYYAHTGGGANYLCIYNNITYPAGTYSGGSGHGAYIYGVEWRTSGSLGIYDFSEVNSKNMHLKSLPCALCLSQPRTTHVMIPGMHKCPQGWHYEYHGFIMSGRHDDKHSSEYICVDRVPQDIFGTQGEQHGAYVAPVATSCGHSLPCGPFVNSYELQCVVCSL